MKQPGSKPTESILTYCLINCSFHQDNVPFGEEIMNAIKRTILLLSALLLCGFSPLQAGTTESQRSVLNEIARGSDGSGWTPLSPQQVNQLATKAKAYLDNYEAHCMPDGLNVDLRWTNHDRTVIEKYRGLGDSAAWTGHYLAALALRYSVTGDTKIVEKIDATLDKLNLLTLVSGTDGYLARHAIPSASCVSPKALTPGITGATAAQRRILSWAKKPPTEQHPMTTTLGSAAPGSTRTTA